MNNKMERKWKIMRGRRVRKVTLGNRKERNSDVRVENSEGGSVSGR